MVASTSADEYVDRDFNILGEERLPYASKAVGSIVWDGPSYDSKSSHHIRCQWRVKRQSKISAAIICAVSHPTFS